MGLIDGLKSLNEHKRLHIDEDAYKRIALNKQIYEGYVPEWHNYTQHYSDGTSGTVQQLTMGMGKVLPQKMASLIFNEKVLINIADEPTKEFLMGVLNDSKFYNSFQRYLEYGIAMSGMAIKVYHHNNKIKLAYASADAFYPLGNDSESIDEALFVSEEFQDGKYYTLLEWNEWKDADTYTIKNELYESTVQEELGIQVPLDTIYEGLEPYTEIPGLRRPLFTYFKLNTANNKDVASPLGISIFENAYDTIKMIDYLYDYLLHEFELGKRRILVDPLMLQPFVDAQGRRRMRFDPNETVYNALNAENQPVKDLTVSLRSDDIIGSINSLLELLSMQVGLSAGTFTFDGKSMKTATEVVSENSLTFQTKKSHENLVAEGIKQLITSILDLARYLGIFDAPEDVEITLDFDDSIIQDRDKDLKFFTLAAQAQLMPKSEAIKRMFKLSDEDVEKWMTRIQSEAPQEFTPEMADMFGIGRGKGRDKNEN